LLVQIFMIYFGLPALFQQLGFTFNIARFPAAVMALSLNASAYLARLYEGVFNQFLKDKEKRLNL
ncbi:hypothetical protein, partial [Aphanothece sacrum]|uniref:hypothetical protein n=1 Tax=Aphanothece sacrum TaxID=1122 RepID=UPI003F657B67